MKQKSNALTKEEQQFIHVSPAMTKEMLISKILEFDHKYRYRKKVLFKYTNRELSEILQSLKMELLNERKGLV